MKNQFYLLLLALSLSTNGFARDKIPLTVNIINGMPIGEGHAKSPIQVPVVYIEDYTLSFTTDHPDYVLNIKDSDGETVYSTMVYSSMTLVPLPSTLTGDYEIELLMGNWKFTGNINL